MNIFFIVFEPISLQFEQDDPPPKYLALKKLQKIYKFIINFQVYCQKPFYLNKTPKIEINLDTIFLKYSTLSFCVLIMIFQEF